MQIELKKLAIVFLIMICILPNAQGGKRFESRYPCREGARTCTSGGIKEVDGEQVYRDCWDFVYTRTCDYPSKNDCGNYAHCYAVGIVDCLLRDSIGNCVNQKEEFSCKRWIPAEVEDKKARVALQEKDGQEGLVCEGIPCIDGNCVDKSYQTNGEMMDSISKLYAVSRMKKGGDLNFSLFAGVAQHCRKKATSYSNCCSTDMSGWGKHFGAHCSPDERVLIDHRKKNLCIYVGKENKQTMGVTTVVKHHYCCFGNMLDKVIQVEGRKQLRGKGKSNGSSNFGSGGNPDCRGLTLEELQRIDFNRMDFTEFIEDFKVKFFGKYKQPNSADIAARVSGSMSNIRRYDNNPNDPQNNLTGWNLGLKDDSYEADEERRLELKRQRREAERLEGERKRHIEESEEYKRRLAEEQRRKTEQRAEAKRLLAIEEAKRVARRKVVEDELNQVRAELTRQEKNFVSSWQRGVNSDTPHLEWVRKRFFNHLNPHSVLHIPSVRAEVEQFIQNIWDKYKYHPEYCENGAHLRPNSIWKNSDFWIAHPGNWALNRFDWCRSVRQLQKLENDLRSGNY